MDELLAIFGVGEAGDLLFSVLEQFLVFGEELLGDGLDIEGFIESVEDVAEVLVSPVDVGELLDGCALLDATFDDDAAQRRGCGAAELGVNPMELVGGCVAEEQQHVLAEFVADPLGDSYNLGLADSVGVCVGVRAGERDVEDSHTGEARDPFGEGRQFDAGAVSGFSQAELANFALEVQDFPE